MAAVGIIGLTIGAAANLRTVVISVRQRYGHFSDNRKEFDDIVEDLTKITKNLEEIELRITRRALGDSGGHIDRHLKTVNKKLQASREIVDKLGKSPIQVHPGPSSAQLSGLCSRIFGANRIHDKLNKVSANLRYVDDLLDTAATLVGTSEFCRKLNSREGVGRHLARAIGDGLLVASEYGQGTVRIWSIQKESSVERVSKASSKCTKFGWLCCFTYDSNGTENLDIAAYECDILGRHTKWIRCVCFSPDGALLASAVDDGTVKL